MCLFFIFFSSALSLRQWKMSHLDTRKNLRDFAFDVKMPILAQNISAIRVFRKKNIMIKKKRSCCEYRIPVCLTLDLFPKIGSMELRDLQTNFYPSRWGWDSLMRRKDYFMVDSSREKKSLTLQSPLPDCLKSRPTFFAYHLFFSPGHQFH